MTRVVTEHGAIEGEQVNGLHVFRAVPYAAAPFGPRRFRPPENPEPWDGVRDAVLPGPAAPQPRSAEDPLGQIYTPAVTGEDCLTLEIWTPDPGAAGLPVMVHIHGGGYVFGSGSVIGYSGRTFARDGVVHVGINYRLGVEGFVYLGEGTDNLGLQDQTAALAWVQRNIAAFGGDPDAVTIFGQSGGAVSVMAHLAMPGSRGLFARAIAQSGCPVPSVDAVEATRITRQLARRLRVPPTPEGFASVSWARAVAATPPQMRRYLLGPLYSDHRSLLLSPFRAVHGTPSLPAPALEVAGSAPGVPLLAGTVRNETVDFVRALSETPVIGPLSLRGLGRALRADGELSRAYRDGQRRITDQIGLIEAAWTDWGFRIPTIRLLEAHAGPGWLYEFRWQPAGAPRDRGTPHGIEMPFVRDDLETVMAVGAAARALLGEDPPQQLAARMHATWIRFAATGEPGWHPYDRKDRYTMLYDATDEVVRDAAGAERAAWTGRR